MSKSDQTANDIYGAKNYETPKSVFAVLAYFLAQRIAGTEDRDEIMKVLSDEWFALHVNGMVSQKPKAFQTVAQEIAHHEELASQMHGPMADWNRERANRLRS